MKYQPIPPSERFERLREAYLHLPVPEEINPYVDKKYKKFCTGDRWITLGYLRGWRDHADADTTRLRAAYAEAEELYEARPLILDGELLTGHLSLPAYSPEEQEEYDRLAEMFQMSSYTLVERPPRKDHLSLDLEKLLTRGISGIRREITEKLGALDLSDPDVYPDYEVVRKYEFYNCLLIELDGVSDLAKRYAAEAKRLADASDGARREELLRLSGVLSVVPENPAGSFYEAIQSAQFFLSGLFGLYPLNRPDRYLYPYYQKDLSAGKITASLAQELVDEYCLSVTDRVFSRAACGFIVGGQDEDGNAVENDLTWMFLTALDHLRLPDPNGALAVNQKTSDGILRYAAEILSHGRTHPAFFNDDEIVRSLTENYGCSRRDAVNYIHTTCAEISIVGKSRSHTTPIIVDLPRLLMKAAGEHPDAADAEELTEAFLEEVRRYVRQDLFHYSIRMLEASRVGNEPARVCALIDDCVARGKSIYEGGERYTFMQPIFIGFSTVVDSVTAVRHLVFEEKRFTLEGFTKIAEADFAGEEPLRQYIVNKLPHYGNDNAETDALAKKIADSLVHFCRSERVPFGRQMMPGTFSYISHATFGHEMGATYDGRRAGYSYSDGCGPVQGRDVNGPTAMALSLSSWDQSELLGGMVVNIKFGRDHLTGDRADALLSVLRTFFARGGIEMQVNVVDRKTLEDAKRNPEQYGDLIVRIGGYSDYFVRLTPALQQEIIDRTEY